MEQLEKLNNFNLIKYTNHYVLTIDKGYQVVTYQGDTLADVLQQLAEAKKPPKVAPTATPELDMIARALKELEPIEGYQRPSATGYNRLDIQRCKWCGRRCETDYHPECLALKQQLQKKTSNK